MATREVRVDWSKTLAEEPATGHNRWHPEIPPAVSCDPGDEVVLATRDAFDGQMGPSATLETVAAPNLNVVHPLTGPVYVNGAEPGDLLEVEVLEVEPDRYGYTVQVPGFGFLRDEFPDPFMVRWRNADGWATSDDLPGVRIPGAPFMGTIGLAPDRRLLQATTAREQAALDRGGFVLPPDPTDAVPADPAIAGEALRTIPPRETAGNVDIKQLSAGARLLIPVYAAGGLFSAGDAHFAQGDCETCGTAIEMRATLHVRFAVHKGLAAARGIRDLQFARDDYVVPPEFAAPRRFFATHRPVGDPGGGEPLGGPDAGRPQRPAQHDRPPRRARRLDATAGLRDLQRRGRPQGQRAGRRAQLRGLGLPAAGHLHLTPRTPATPALRGVGVRGSRGRQTDGGSGSTVRGQGSGARCGPVGRRSSRPHGPEPGAPLLAGGQLAGFGQPQGVPVTALGPLRPGGQLALAELRQLILE